MELAINQTDSSPRVDQKDGHALLNLAQGWLKTGNPVVALELLKSALNAPEAVQEQGLRARILQETGRALMMQSDWDRAEIYYLEAQQNYLNLENLKGAAECARNRANMYFQNGKYHESMQLCEQALQWASVVQNHQLRATILNTLAAIKSAIGELKEAVQIFKLCLADFQTAGNLIRQGYVLLNIGLTQTELGEFESALANLNRALAIALDERDQTLVEICYQNIARCHLAQRETNLAKAVIDTARKILPGLNSRALEAELTLIDCQILRTLGNLEKAEMLLRRTLQMAQDSNLKALEADLLLEQALLNKDKGKFELAISGLEAAVNQYKQLGIE